MPYSIIGCDCLKVVLLLTALFVHTSCSPAKPTYELIRPTGGPSLVVSTEQDKATRGRIARETKGRLKREDTLVSRVGLSAEACNALLGKMKISNTDLPYSTKVLKDNSGVKYGMRITGKAAGSDVSFLPFMQEDILLGINERVFKEPAMFKTALVALVEKSAPINISYRRAGTVRLLILFLATTSSPAVKGVAEVK